MAKRVSLIVDDEPSVRAFVCAVLRRNGFVTVEAEHGEEALALVRAASGAITLLITDIRMPRMNGSTLAKTVHREFPQIGVLVMSGYDDKPPDNFAFIAKPFTADALSAVVAEVAPTAVL